MPIFLSKRVFKDALVGIWKIVESEQYFYDHLELHHGEIEWLRTIKGSGRRTHWLASRWLLHVMSDRELRSACLKDEFGKPYLKDSDHYISLSHSGSMVAVVAGLMPVGVDIQMIVPKINRIKDKFCSPEELSHANSIDELRLLHAIWGAKEAMFKAYGRKQVDFREHMKIEFSEVERQVLHAKGFFDKPDYKATFDIFMENVQDYMLVYAIQDDT